MSLYWRKKVLLAKIETTYGTDPNPTGAANTIEAQDISLKPMMGSDADTELERPYFGATGTIPVDLHSEITFSVQLTGSGASGTAPAWGVLLRGCSMAETVVASTSVTYNPITDDPESLTIYLNIDGTLYRLLGARGNVVFEVNASGIPVMKFTFKGLFTLPSTQALPTPDHTGFQKVRAASNANTPVFTLDGSDFVMRNFKLDLGNKVEGDFLINQEDIDIIDRNSMVEMQIRATPLTTFDPWSAAFNTTDVAIALQHGITAGHRIAFAIPTAQLQRPDGLVDGSGKKEWPLRLIPKPTTGSDELTLTLT